MITEAVIQSIYQRQGWKPSTLNDDPALDADNKISRSGKFFNVDYHPLVTIRNIYKAQENAHISDRNFNEYLKELQLKSIRKILHKLFPSKLILSQVLTTSDSGNTDTYTVESGQFVGVSFCFEQSRRASLLLRQVGLYFDGEEDLTLYLFHSSQNTPIATFENVTSQVKSEVFTNINHTLTANSDTLKGGTYYLGYYSDDLTGSKPIRRDERRNTNCFVDINFIQVDAQKGVLFDTDDVETTTKEFLNLDYSFYKDYSNFIIENEALLDELIGRQLALEVLRIMYTSTRSNYEEREFDDMSKQRMWFDMHGNSSNENYPYSKGIIHDIEIEVKRLYKLFHRKARMKVNTLR